MNIHQILLEKAAQNELGHFYILESPLPEHDAFDHLIHFVENFIREYYQKIEIWFLDLKTYYWKTFRN